MRAAGVSAANDPVRTLELPRPPPPSAGDVLIAVHAAGVGNWDELMRAGAWLSGLRGPHALGVEVAGVVSEVGAAVPQMSAGDEVAGYVFPFRTGGAWAEFELAPAIDLARKPEALPWEAAAVLPVPGLTAFQTLTEVLEVRRGQRLFVHGAGGVTGGLLVQLAALRKLSVVATAGAAGRSRLRDFGASVVIDRARPDWRERVLAALGGPADVVVNAVPGAADEAIRTTAPGGRFASIAGGVTAEYHADATEVFVRPDGAQLQMLLEMLNGGDISLFVEHAYPLARAAEALARVRVGTHGSAVVLAVA
jgi:NADPH:quinone reductase-like Zn-dependent oxidoreductase